MITRRFVESYVNDDSHNLWYELGNKFSKRGLDVWLNDMGCMELSYDTDDGLESVILFTVWKAGSTTGFINVAKNGRVVGKVQIDTDSNLTGSIFKELNDIILGR